MSTDFATFLEQSVRAGSPLVYCESSEDERVRDEALRLADDLPGVVFMSWSCTAGLFRAERNGSAQVFAAEAVPTFEQLLTQLVAQNNEHLFERDLILVARDAVGAGSMHEGSADAALRFVRLLKDLFELWEPQGGRGPRRCLVFTGLGWAPPPALNGYLQTTVLPLPSQEELQAALLVEPGSLKALRRHGLETGVFAQRVAGLPLLAVRDIVRRLDQLPPPEREPEAARTLIDAIKKEEIRKTGVLEILPTNERLDLGGFSNFRNWFKERRPFLETPERPELRPRGVLFLGFPGCGKSHAARWIAQELGLPLIALSLGQVQDRWVGASEARFRLALRTLEAAAPVVVLMDEIEKDLAGQGTDSSGVTTRLVGDLLRWMADRQAPVFIVATCNNADRIPPELTRAGRFDANFIVPVPSQAERGEILDAIAKRLKLNVAADARAFVVEQTHEFTGAEIHQLLVEAAYKLGTKERTLTRASVAAAKRSVVPLMQRDEGRELWAKYERKKDAGYRPVGEG